MDGLFLLVGLSFIPIQGVYGPALDKTRKAAFIQSGLQADWDTVRGAAEKRVPPILRHASVVGAAIYKREVELNSKTLHLNLKQDSARALLTLEF